MPNKEEASWDRFCDEAYTKFLDGTYAGAYERTLTDAFNASLPEFPPWQAGLSSKSQGSSNTRNR